MPLPQRNDKDLLDLVLLGLTYVQETNTTTLRGWTGNGILKTLKDMGVIDGQQSKNAATNYQTIQHFQNVTHIVHTPPRPTHNRLGELIRGNGKDGNMLLIAILNTPQLIYSSLLGAPGYPLLVTAAGIERAHDSAQRFLPHMTRDSFMGSWATRLRHIRGMYGNER